MSAAVCPGPARGVGGGRAPACPPDPSRPLNFNPPLTASATARPYNWWGGWLGAAWRARRRRPAAGGAGREGQPKARRLGSCRPAADAAGSCWPSPPQPSPARARHSGVCWAGSGEGSGTAAARDGVRGVQQGCWGRGAACPPPPPAPHPTSMCRPIAPRGNKPNGLRMQHQPPPAPITSHVALVAACPGPGESLGGRNTRCVGSSLMTLVR